MVVVGTRQVFCLCEEILNQTGNPVSFSKSIIVLTIIIISIIIEMEGEGEGRKKMKCYDGVLFPRISYWWSTLVLPLFIHFFVSSFFFLLFPSFFLSWEFGLS